MNDKIGAAIDRVCETVKQRNEAEAVQSDSTFVSSYGSFRSATEFAVANSMYRVRKDQSYQWRNQYALVTSWADTAVNILRLWWWLDAYRKVIKALENPLCGVKGQCLGQIRRGCNEFLGAETKSSNGYSELSSVIRRLSTKRGRKMAAKAGISVDALREKLTVWPKPQPNTWLMDEASFENLQSAMAGDFVSVKVPEGKNISDCLIATDVVTDVETEL